MPPSAGYPIEDFLEAITAQLDQTQDALRLKAVNRPLTFALKDFNVDLKVFVEMDSQGRVTFRPAGPNEEGASTVSIAFTTITRPMIEENTISMAMTQAPSLDELGLKREEQARLAKIGVRNAAQLRNLQRNAGEDTLSRQTGVDLGRIREALHLARPVLDDVTADAPAQPAPHFAPQAAPRSGAMPATYHDRPAGAPRQGMRQDGPGNPEPPPRDPHVPARGAFDGGDLVGQLRDRLSPHGARPAFGAAAPEPARRRLMIDPDARSIRIAGRNLIDEGRRPAASLDGRPLSLLDASSMAASFSLPPGQGGGRLTIELPDGSAEDFDLVERPAPNAPPYGEPCR